MRKKSLYDRAKQEFGTTDDPFEAGYLLPDGTFLDFSGKRDGGSGGERVMDHRQIEILFDFESEYRWDKVIAFMKGGAIRFMTIGLMEGDFAIGLGLVVAPTETQRRVVRALGRRKVIIDVYSASGNDKQFFEFENGRVDWDEVEAAFEDDHLKENPSVRIDDYNSRPHLSVQDQEVVRRAAIARGVKETSDNAFFITPEGTVISVLDTHELTARGILVAALGRQNVDYQMMASALELALEAGLIRVVLLDGGFAFATGTVPTASQWKVLSNLARRQGAAIFADMHRKNEVTGESWRDARFSTVRRMVEEVYS